MSETTDELASWLGGILIIPVVVMLGPFGRPD